MRQAQAMAEKLSINIAQDFTDTPGARYPDDGEFSGEEFRVRLLEPLFLKAREQGHNILVDLDNTDGYATSFLEEAFGGLARRYDISEVNTILQFKSDDEPGLIEEVKTYIREARKGNKTLK
jgi:hypothetical protein